MSQCMPSGLNILDLFSPFVGARVDRDSGLRNVHVQEKRILLAWYSPVCY